MISSKTILLIEDEPIHIEMYQAKFEEAGYQVMEAREGAEAFDKIRAQKPDLIILDILLPGLSGFAVLERLKANPETKEIPVIILSNLSDKEDQERGKRLGAIRYLVKADWTPQQILDKVREILKD
ncbi:response regulator [Candidatus Azambacteria bacterium]|nr:response regulator [Candidatus Azambacteria bacterium]MBI2587907.1 response regulator [Candidatus Azambacteria bacterium]